MPVFSDTAIQISGVNTPSMSRVTIDCFMDASLARTAGDVSSFVRIAGRGSRVADRGSRDIPARAFEIQVGLPARRKPEARPQGVVSSSYVGSLGSPTAADQGS